MSQTNRIDAPLFELRNHHSAACGAPPHIDDLRPAHLPMAVFPTKDIVRILRRGGAKISIDRALSVQRVFTSATTPGSPAM